MKNHCNIRALLITSSLACGALLVGCVGEAPGEGADPAVASNEPVLVAAEPEAAGAAGVAGAAATAFTQAEDASTFAVYVTQGGRAHKVGSVQVQGHVNELTVDAHASPSGARVAVAPNYDTFAGTELRVLDEGGTARVLENARVASPVWSPDSAELAYLVMSHDETFELRISDGVKPGRTIGTLAALRAKILGWSTEKDELYVIMDVYQGGNAPVVSFGVVDVATGALRTPFASDEESSTFYRDFQLVEAQDGSVLVSFVKATTSGPCGGSSRLQLATVNGTLLAEHGATTDSYSQGRWSPDGKQVAYEVRACADKQQGLEIAQQRMAAINGIHLAEVGEKSSKRIATGLLHDFRLAGLRHGSVVLGSATRGLHTLQGTNKVVDLYQLEAEHPTLGGGGVSGVLPQQGPTTSAKHPTLGGGGVSGVLPQQGPTTSAKNVTAQYVHQLWDTPDWFNGNSACGPTSSVMDLAGYQLNAWPMTASWPSSHTSNYGQYVATSYSYGGYTFSTSTRDPSGNWAAGAYGHMVKDASVGSTWAYISSFLDVHLTWAVAEASGSIGANWVKQQLNANLLVVTSGSVFGYGHIILIRGYTDDNRWYVNDPYGYQVSGSYNGTNVIYTWSQIAPAHFWAG